MYMSYGMEVGMCISCGMEIRTQDRLCMQCCAVDQQSLLVVRGGSWQDQGGNRRAHQ